MFDLELTVKSLAFAPRNRESGGGKGGIAPRMKVMTNLDLDMFPFYFHFFKCIRLCVHDTHTYICVCVPIHLLIVSYNLLLPQAEDAEM